MEEGLSGRIGVAKLNPGCPRSRSQRRDTLMLTRPRSGRLTTTEGKSIAGEEVKMEEASAANGPKFNRAFEQN